MNPYPGITIVGLGPGDSDLLTRQAWEVLNAVSEVYLRTTSHPVVGDLPKTLQIHSFDYLYEDSERFEQVYQQIVEQVLVLGERPEGVVYAVPGHPFIAENTAPSIYLQAKEKGIPVRIIEGISFIEPTFTALGLDPFPQTTLVDAFDLAAGHFPKFPAGVPVLVTQVYSRPIASEIKLTLMLVYPDDHPVKLVHAAGTQDQLIEDIPLYELDRSTHIGLLTSLYVPALDPLASLEALQEIIARLRAPDGCPWDQEQTYLSLRKYLMEEAFEAISAIDEENPEAMQEEFGDLLLQVFMQIQIAAEIGDFTIADVTKGINEKLVRRHPHVFGDTIVSGTDEVSANWEAIKQHEKSEKGEPEGLLDSIPAALPALAQSNAIQKRAARAGFDWPDTRGVFDKIREEIGELEQADTPENVSAELGDLLFIIARLADKLDVEPETSLREANHRFRRRFSLIEKYAQEQNRSLSSMNLDELNSLWDRAKRTLAEED